MSASKRGVALVVLFLVLVILVETGFLCLLLLSTDAAIRDRTAPEIDSAGEIADAGVHLALARLKQATDARDNDGDVEADEGIRYHRDMLDPRVIERIEGNLGRIGTLAWREEDDRNGNGLPDFGEAGVSPLPLAGGALITYSVFSQKDGIDNDWDGAVDEGDEAGSVTLVSRGRFGRATAVVSYTGSFARRFTPVDSPRWRPGACLISGDDLRIAGNARFLGTRGNVHANRFLALLGTPTVAGNATACRGLTRSDRAVVDGVAGGRARAWPLPDVRPEALLDGCRYVLAGDGRVTDGDRRILFDPDSRETFRGWSPGQGGWTFSGHGVDPSLARGSYFVAGHATLAGTGQAGIVGKGAFGPSTRTFRMSVVATGDIEVGGNTRLRHDLPGGLLLVAGGDIRIQGNEDLDQYLEGLIIAGEQVVIAGSADIEGAVLARASRNDSGLNETSEVRGSPAITYNGGLVTAFPVLDPNRPFFILEPSLISFKER